MSTIKQPVTTELQLSLSEVTRIYIYLTNFVLQKSIIFSSLKNYNSTEQQPEPIYLQTQKGTAVLGPFLVPKFI